MLPDDVWDEQAADDYDTPGEGMFAPEVVGPAVDFLAGLAGDGAALEFAIGTGRIAVPLAERGVAVSGIDSSRPMIARMRAKTTAMAPPSELDLMGRRAGWPASGWRRATPTGRARRSPPGRPARSRFTKWLPSQLPAFFEAGQPSLTK